MNVAKLLYEAVRPSPSQKLITGMKMEHAVFFLREVFSIEFLNVIKG